VPAYKTDVSFLEKLALGAIGTRRVLADLGSQGHRVVELERGSLDFKIWKRIKIKRVRVPDILCVFCGTRVESRSKTKLEVSMSHSRASEDRGWDFGLNEDDLVAFVQCTRVSEDPTAWEASHLVQYLSVGEMRGAYSGGRVITSGAKGAEEGFEIRITWPTCIASADGDVIAVEDARIKYRRKSDGRILTVQRSKGGVDLQPQVSVGDAVAAGQFLASAVPIHRTVPCAGGRDEDYYAELLGSSSLSDRYTAAKALSRFDEGSATSLLATKASDEAEHIYVRLEAAAGLMKRDDERGRRFIQTCLGADYLEHRLEAVIVLGEVGGAVGYRLLLNTLNDQSQDPEIRAGAAWSIGQVGERAAVDALVECFTGVDERIRTEAARALSKLARRFPDDVTARLGATDSDRRPGVAWALSRLDHVDVDRLTRELVDEDARRWVAYVVGAHHPEMYVREIEELREADNEVYFAVTVLWNVFQSWVSNLDEHL
jgi:hypothetical protein